MKIMRGRLFSLIAAVANENLSVRWSAAEALSTLADARAVESSRERLGDKDADVREAAEALEKLRGPNEGKP